MDKRNKIIIILLLIITVGVVVFCIYSVMNKEIVETDADKFRTEYMSLNDEINENTGNTYLNISIVETNTVEYITVDEAVELLESGTGVIYFGYPTCPWCRNLVPVLTSVAEELNEVIYYVNIYDIRSSFEIGDNSIEKIKEGTEGYYKLLEVLDEVLEDYSLEDEEGNVYDTGEKRLYAPTVVGVKNGEITSIHVGTVETQENAYEKLTTNETEELEAIIKSLIYSTRSNEVCSSDSNC